MAKYKILPEDPNAAMQKMIDLTKECLSLLESEDEKITRNDMIQFAVNEETKNRAFAYYEQAGKEFALVSESFQGKVSPHLVSELQSLQMQVADQAESNNARLDQIPSFRKKS